MGFKLALGKRRIGDVPWDGSITAPTATLTSAGGAAPEVDVTYGTDIFPGYYLVIDRSTTNNTKNGTGYYASPASGFPIIHQFTSSEFAAGIITNADLLLDGYVDPSGSYWQQYRWAMENGSGGYTYSAWSNEISGTVTDVTTVFHTSTGTNKNQYLTVSSRQVNMSRDDVGAYCHVRATQQPTVDLYQFEVTLTDVNTSVGYHISIAVDDGTLDYSGHPQPGNGSTVGIAWRISPTECDIRWPNSNQEIVSMTFQDGDIITVRGDKTTDSFQAWRTRSGTTTAIGSAHTSSLSSHYVGVGLAYTGQLDANFGQSAFAKALDGGYANHG